ncbi:hypothetical protein [Spiroplasma endosymbiont of Polydrusus formosus]|uniref:hypothetical protein n=1 Tax=Spiroplasma endosymbiont of Polydrusus formosus TaxID=3139326 RepID=UPI0035B539D2
METNSSSEELENIISKLNPNQQRLIRQRDNHYGRFQTQAQIIQNNNSDETKID